MDGIDDAVQHIAEAMVGLAQAAHDLTAAGKSQSADAIRRTISLLGDSKLYLQETKIHLQRLAGDA